MDQLQRVKEHKMRNLKLKQNFSGSCRLPIILIPVCKNTGKGAPWSITEIDSKTFPNSFYWSLYWNQNIFREQFHLDAMVAGRIVLNGGWENSSMGLLDAGKHLLTSCSNRVWVSDLSRLDNDRPPTPARGQQAPRPTEGHSTASHLNIWESALHKRKGRQIKFKFRKACKNPLVSLFWFWLSIFHFSLTKRWPKLDFHHMGKVCTRHPCNFLGILPAAPAARPYFPAPFSLGSTHSVHLTCISKKAGEGGRVGTGVFLSG